MCEGRRVGVVDRLDLHIIRTMGMRPFETWPRDPARFRPGFLAAAVGVAPETVTERISRMEQDGVLVGYEVYPNVHHLGLGQTTFHLHVDPDEKTRVKDALEPVEGIVGLYDFLGADLCVDICYRSDADLDRKLRLVAHLARQEGVVRFYDRALPAPVRPLTKLDWRILAALRGHGRLPPEDVADAVGVSAKTIRRRQSAMAAEGAFDTVAVVDLGRIPDLQVFNLVFFLRDAADAATTARIRSTFDDRFFYAWQPPSLRFGSYHVTLFARTNAEVEALRRKASGIEGVERAEVMIPCGATWDGTWLDEAIRERAEGGPVRPAVEPRRVP